MRIHQLFLILIIIFSGLNAFADPVDLVWGGGAPWFEMESFVDLEIGSGRLGHDALILSTRKNPVDADTDLYLDFDDSMFTDQSENYSIVRNSLLKVEADRARLGSGAALCNTAGQGLTLTAKTGSLFADGSTTGSFTIEFWLYPAVAENGSLILSWRSSRSENREPLYQYLRAAIFNNRLEWTFSNVWLNHTGRGIDVTLAGSRNLVPRRWSLHSLSYSADSGLIEYRVDGVTEAIRYLTSTGSESGTVFQARFGPGAHLEIAPRFSGIIDEFRIVRRFSGIPDIEQRHTEMERFPSSGGTFRTRPVAVGAVSAKAVSLAVLKDEPAETGTALWIRFGDNHHEWTDSEPAWHPVPPDGRLPALRGRFFQLRGALYTDGRGMKTPVISRITLRIERDDPPLPPARLTARAQGGSVHLSWIPSIDFDTRGYLVYYGTRPGEYLSSGSPLDAGSARELVINGLENGRLYYFAVAAYDESGSRHPGPLSREVFARPGEAP